MNFTVEDMDSFLSGLYEKSIGKWKQLLKEAEIIHLDDEFTRHKFFSSRIVRPCAFCRVLKGGRCLINLDICSCIHNGYGDSLYRLGHGLKTKKKVIKWIKWMIVALTKEWRRLKDK